MSLGRGLGDSSPGQGDSYSHLGEVVLATEFNSGELDPRRTRQIILLLAASVALMMTGFGIIMPVFARRLGELGSGVEGLGLMTMAFALAQFVSAPVMGSFADRFGRRPLILLGLAAFAASNVGFLMASSTFSFILVRTLEGALSAGIFPAAMGVVADIVPEERRAQWVGIVMGSYGAGFIFGPTIGGVLYDGWGFAAPFVASATMATLAFLAAFVLVPETRTPEVRRREALQKQRQDGTDRATEVPALALLPRPLHIFGTLLLVDFIGVFAFAFVEPQMVFFFYEQLEWTTIQFGVVVGAYGLAMVFSQTALGRLSDSVGRKPVIILGVLLTTTFYVGLATVSRFGLTLVVAVIAGFGSGLTMPAMSAFYLDITAPQYRARVMGIKESGAALGGVAGPLLVVVVSALTSPRGVFAVAAALVAVTLLLAAVVLKEPQRALEVGEDVDVASSRRRALCAQASLRGIVLRARASRRARV
jgi:DHA1 family multidrug resistance protein-like MFS transporter